MKNEIENKLNTIFDKHQNEIENETKQKEKKIESENKFLVEFYKVRESIIKPAMEELEKRFLEKDYDCEITSYDYDKNPGDNRRKDAGIKFSFFLKKQNNLRYQSSIPFVSFVADLIDLNVIIFVSTISPLKGGSSGAKNKIQLEDITIDLIQNEIIDMVGKVLNN